MASNEERLHEILDLYEQAKKEGDKPTELKAWAAYRRESQPSFGVATTYDTAVGSIPGRALLGLGKIGVAGPAQVGAWAGSKISGDPSVSDWVNTQISDLNAAQERGREALGSEGFDWASLLGGGIGGGAAQVTGKIAGGVLPRIAEGAKVGTAFGAATPVDVEEVEDPVNTKIVQTLFGAIAGGTLPALTGTLGKLWEIGKNAIGKISPKEIGKILNHYAGDSRDRIIKELEKNRIYVPGSEPTAGQAAARVGSTEFSALSKYGETLEPTTAFATRQTQEQARAKALREVSGQPGQLEKAIEKLTAQSKVRYEAAFKSKLDMSKGGNKELSEITTNPYYEKAAKIADRQQEAKYGSKIVTDAEGNETKVILGPMTARLHLIKEELDSMIRSAGKSDDAIKKGEVALVSELKKKTVDFLAKRNPVYETARAAHEKASIPINQMTVGRELEAKLTGALDDKEMAAAYSRQVRDILEVSRKATGRSVEKITDLFTPKQIESIYGVARDLQRQARLTALAQKGSPEISRRIAAESHTPTAKLRILDRVWVVMTSVLNTATGEGSKKSLLQVAKVLEDPKLTAELMRLATPQARAEVGDLLREWARLSTAGGAALAAGEVATQ